MSTTFSGANPVPLPNANVPLPPQRMFPSAPPPASSGYAPHDRDASMRFRAVDEELTRSELAASEAGPTAQPPFNQTLESGARPEMPGLNTTLVEGKTPAHIAEAIRSAPPPSAPPSSQERPIARALPEPSPPVQPSSAAVPTSKAPYVAIIGVLLIAVVIVALLLLRHH
jgi:hypothetical protein